MCIIKSGKLCYESKSEKCNMVYKFSHKFHLTAGFFVFVLNIKYIPNWNNIV